ncbi:MAG TPA: phosphatidylglycerol lysyltransferase domain-containing protein, partial [Acidimicrobiia bacterium]|nr:phosphatidylglycerol lysyltransferase domain-containing protein [Acidimicrobiia bacterium]
ASRLAYRKMARYLSWLALPLLLALVIKIPLVVALAEHRGQAESLANWSHRLLLIAGVVFVDVALVGLTVGLGARQVWRALAGSLGALGSRDGNRAAYTEAEILIKDGLTGFISGHTHRAELRPVGEGFYANTGCCDEILVERPGRLGLPPVFGAEQERSWIELEAGAELRVRLHHTRTPQPSEKLLERLVARRRADTPPGPEVVAEFPHGPSWPQDETSQVRLRRIRRRAALALGAAGVLNLVSAVTPPLRDRLRWVLAAVPLAVPQVAAVAVALAGLGLLLLGRGVRRGQRRAWAVAVALLLGSVVLHIVKGVDVEEVAVAALVAGYLLVHRRAFRVASDAGSARSGLLWAAAGAAVATAVGTAAAWLLKAPTGRLPLHRAALAALERLVGVSSVPVAHRLDDFLTPVLTAVGFGLVAVLGWQLLRPVIHRVVDHSRAERTRAGLAVARYGADSLAYFALRDDKQYFFFGETVVAYGVIGGVALVSPDPIGPVGERAAAWAAFRRFADESGLIVACMGVTEDWLPIYRASGLRTLYVGDEAVVDCTAFTLDGSKMKSVRQAYNRVARGGYTVEFHDPAKVDPVLADELRALSLESRRGEAERGFSMTLGRIFQPEDAGLLLAVCKDAEGRA